jgi:3',5'-nucleoside bisphosphate phosphatase
MSSRIDLHTHSHHSDGMLSPAELVGLAAQRQVGILALTDHDTVAGCAEARSACEAAGICFVAGVELSCQWRDRGIHIVGLGLDPADGALLAHCEAVLAQRCERIEAMAQRLTRAGLPGAALAAAARLARSPTRTHLARALVDLGLVPDLEQAFARWLKRGRPGYVHAPWPQLPTAVQCIVGAGGIAVLAHPHRYSLSAGVLRELVADFKQAGGEAIEVSLAGMAPKDAERMASLARRYQLAGSVGSDFHEPDLPWRPLGRFAKLPDLITPIAARLVSQAMAADERSGR